MVATAHLNYRGLEVYNRQMALATAGGCRLLVS